MGERKTLRLVAKYADACNLFATSPAEVAHKIDVLNEHCAAQGRDPAEIQKTIIGGPSPLDNVDDYLKSMAEYAALGVDQVWAGPDPAAPAQWVTEVCEQVVPRLAGV